MELMKERRLPVEQRCCLEMKSREGRKGKWQVKAKMETLLTLVMPLDAFPFFLGGGGDAMHMQRQTGMEPLPAARLKHHTESI
jgi:hypothetical protein